jgi:cell wall-associated NlpC family hydrolase
MRFTYGIIVVLIILFSCKKTRSPILAETITKNNGHSVIPPLAPGNKSHYVSIATGKTTPFELVTFARSLKGISYKYGSIDPEQGFDCSGFVTYVFNHFRIRVPRPSVDFTFVNRDIDIKKSKPGDLILFTGTDSTARTVGHMGIIVSNHRGNLIFIHATSGNGYSVIETPLNSYYQERYIKTIRVFTQNNR